MSTQEIIQSLKSNYLSFTDYINELTPEEYTYSYQQKWTAGQQLAHLVLCGRPLVQVFSLDKAVIEQNFGKTDRLGRGYEALLEQYFSQVKGGGKAPGRFVPEAIAVDQKPLLMAALKDLIEELCAKIETFTDHELDTLLIPHPLLGNLTLREMLYNAIYHVIHHQKLAEEYLKHRVVNV